MKKVFNILMIIVLVVPYFVMPMNVEGKTIGDLEKELSKIEADLKEKEKEEKLTEAEIERTKQNIKNIENTITKINTDIVKLGEEIEQLNEDIKEKEEEIKEILKFLQVSSGESVYLEYAFGAKTFTDFIYRAAVAEQLANYNDDLIKKYNDMIIQNKNKTEELKNKTEELSKQKGQLKINIEKLGSKLTEIYDLKIDLKEDIKIRKQVIQTYKDKGCKSDEDINTCGNKGMIYDSSFLRPVDTAQITSGFGWRTFTANGKLITDFHTGIDLAYGGDAVPIYAAANGVVVAVAEYPFNSIKCGGNTVFINHVVNGKPYMTMYMHLRKIMVKSGQTVTKNTVIATMGGDPRREWWDDPTCSTGQHLHFTVTDKHYNPDLSLGGVYANKINPALVINFPGDGEKGSYLKWVEGRYTKY